MSTPAVVSDASRRRDRVRLLLGSITSTTERLAVLLEEAQVAEDHLTLGYTSWTAYVAGEYRDALAGLSAAFRRPVVEALAASGMPTRAIAEVAGISQSTATRDVQASHSDSPAPSATEFFASTKEMTDIMVMGDATEDEFEAALTVAREQDDLSRENVVVHLPVKRVTGADGRSYRQQAPPRAPRRRSLPDAYRDAQHELHKVLEKLERLHADDRFTVNRADLHQRHRAPLDSAAELLAKLQAGLAEEVGS